jgi:hypothetical protein
MTKPTPIAELDFNLIVDQLRAFLQGQERFKDYDFSGSNMSVLLDVLAYNTYQNNFYTNMVASEMFLDSARTESSVMSHAKELNYLPRSRMSARAEINLTITADRAVHGESLILPAGQRFTAQQAGQSFTFSTITAQVAYQRPDSDVYVAKCVPIYEGEFVEEQFIITSTKSTYELSNTGVDISSLEMTAENGDKYRRMTSIYGVVPMDRVFYVEPSLMNGYKVEFGRDRFGRQPAPGEKFTIRYRVCSGDAANGAAKFSIQSPMYPTLITVVSPAIGGAEKESISDIKFFAPKSVQAQERAVTARDYEVLLMSRFGNSMIKSISVYGGEQMDPPRYGRVAISVQPVNGSFVTDTMRSQINEFLADKTPIPIRPIIIEPMYMFVEMGISARVRNSSMTKSKSELNAEIKNVVAAYADVEMNRFSGSLNVSKLSSAIDGSDTAILGSTITATPYVEYVHGLVASTISPQFNFNMALRKSVIPADVTNASAYQPAIKSSVYTVDGIDVFFQDDGKGNLATYSAMTKQILNPTVGTVDYATGIVRLINFNVDVTVAPRVKIYAFPEDMNFTSPKDRIVQVRSADVKVTIQER